MDDQKKKIKKNLGHWNRFFSLAVPSILIPWRILQGMLLQQATSGTPRLSFWQSPPRNQQKKPDVNGGGAWIIFFLPYRGQPFTTAVIEGPQKVSVQAQAHAASQQRKWNQGGEQISVHVTAGHCICLVAYCMKFT